MRHATIALAAAAAAALATAACGSSGKTTSSSSGSASSAAPAPKDTQAQTMPSKGAARSTVSLSADPGGQLKFSSSQASARAGKVTLKLTNPSSVPHGLSIEGKGLDREGRVIQQGASSALTVDLKPGTYTFYCPVPGHRQAGMQGTLAVQ